MRNKRLRGLIHQRTYGMGLSQGRAARLGHSNVSELSFIDQFLERPDGFLDRNLGVDSSALEQIQFLGSPEVLVNVVNATPHVFLAANLLSHNLEEAKGRNSRRIWLHCCEIQTAFDGQEGLVGTFGILLVERSE